MSPIADLQEQLQAILGDPEAMGQITAIARALTGSAPASAGQPHSPPPKAQDVEFIPVEPPSAPPEEPTVHTQQPQPSQDISSLIGVLSGGNIPDIDPKLISIALRVFSEYSAQDDEKTALLSALKPFLKAERLEKMEKAEKIARLSRVVRVALQLLKEEGGGNV